MERGKITTEVEGERIIVTMEGAHYRAVFFHDIESSRLLQSLSMSIDKKNPDRSRRELFERLAWDAAIAKARELGWIT